MITDKITDGCDGRNHCLVKRHFHKVEILLFRFWILGQSLEAAFKLLIARNASFLAKL
jgi:hypothetical protein